MARHPLLVALALLPGVASQADHLPAAGSKKMRDPFEPEEIDRFIYSLHDLEDRGEVTRLFSNTGISLFRTLPTAAYFPASETEILPLLVPCALASIALHAPQQAQTVPTQAPSSIPHE